VVVVVVVAVVAFAVAELGDPPCEDAQRGLHCCRCSCSPFGR
jgi:hypothetical protein